MHILPPLLANIQNLPWVAIVAIVGGFMIAIIDMIVGQKTSQRRLELWHETTRIALEKGQPMPPMPEYKHPQPHRTQHSDIRKGLVLVAIGGGLYLFLGALINSKMAWLGAIPGFIGIALLLYGIGNALFSKDKSPSDDRPPQS